MNIDNFEKNNPELLVKKGSSIKYGHSDVLDTLWGDLMHLLLVKEQKIEIKKILNYLDWLANEIYNFVNKKIRRTSSNIINNYYFRL